MVISVSIIIIVIVTLSTFVVLCIVMRRKCKFDKLYENVSTSYVRLNGECHKKNKVNSDQ